MGGVTVDGFTSTVLVLRELAEDAGEESAGALWEISQEIMTDSKENFVPVDTGALRSSGFVEKPEEKPSGWSVRLGFGGPAGSRDGSGVHTGNKGEAAGKDIGYAVVQHERLDYNHTVGQAKYLEAPALDRAAMIEEIMADKLNKRLDL